MGIGSQKLRKRNINVAESAVAVGTPATFSATTDMASNVPSPPGDRPIVRKRWRA